jgi:hypothetical protein
MLLLHQIQRVNWKEDGFLIVLQLQEDDKPFSVHLSDESFETYELDPPSYTLETTKKELKQMYYDMVSVRCVFTQLPSNLNLNSPIC